MTDRPPITQPTRRLQHHVPRFRLREALLYAVLFLCATISVSFNVYRDVTMWRAAWAIQDLAEKAGK